MTTTYSQGLGDTFSSHNSHLFESTHRKDTNARRLNPPASHDTHGDASTSRPYTDGDNDTSLMINYLPTKFSNGTLLSSESFHARRHGSRSASSSSSIGSLVVIQNESRPISECSQNEGYYDFREDASTHPWLSRRRANKYRKMRWNKFKWILFSANVLLMTYAFVGLIFCLLTWFNTFQRADVICVGNRTELVVSTLACLLGVFVSLIGWAGILLNNRSFLAAYACLLWIVFIFVLVPGYITYKRKTFNLEGKINAQWSQSLGVVGRLRIQNELRCCGYFSPFVEASVSQTCYARSTLPGCKLAYLDFEGRVLKRWYMIVFGLAFVHVMVMVVGLLCSNHVTYRFGKGMMPKAYRLSLTSMAIIMEGFANELAEQYGKT